GRHARDRLARRDVPGDDGACANECAGADPDAAEHDDARAERRAALDDGAHELPVGICLELARVSRRARKLVVDEERAVADENLVLDLDACADERMTLDFAASADHSVTLDLDEWPHARVVADAAAVKIRKRRD